MDKLYLDVYNVIFLFCTHRELLSLSFCNKFLYNNINEKVWKRIGDRDHPLLKIQSKKDYYSKNPLFVSNHELLYEIQNNYWANNIYKTNNLQKNYISNIMKSMTKVNHLRDFYTEFRKTHCTNWGCAVQILIGELLDYSETVRNELFKTYCI